MAENRFLGSISKSSIRNLLSKSVSTTQIRRKSKFNSENIAPPDPNTQITDLQVSLLPSPTKPIISHSELPKSNLQELPDSPVKVVVRIRPASGGDRTVRKVSDDSISVEDKKFTFDSVLDLNSTQEDIFQIIGIPVVKNALAGYNTSILAYGQTASGKSYTMWGPQSSMSENPSSDSPQGISSRIFQMLFSEIQREQESCEGKHVNFRCTFLEIYDDQIGDLLNPLKRNLEIKEDSKNNFYVENLTEEYVNSYEEVTEVMITGLSSRKIGATSYNSKSSRSHVIFTLIIESLSKDTSRTSKISLIDLAGFEKDIVENAWDQCANKGKFVETSTLQLGHLVNILVDKNEAVTYKSNYLTQLLKDSFQGNTKLSVICNISSDYSCTSETLSTLRFGERVKLLQNKTVKNEITENDSNDLSDQIRNLKDELIRAKSKDGQHESDTKSAREGLNQLRQSIHRSLILPNINYDSEEELNINEDDVKELQDHIHNLNDSVETFNNTELTQRITNSDEHYSSCSDEEENVNIENPTLSDSPKIKSTNEQARPDMIGPTDYLAASLHKGLEIIDYHKRNSPSNKSLVSFSFKHLENNLDESSKVKELESLCKEQAAKIEQLEQMNGNKLMRSSSSDNYETKPFDTNERESLLKEIEGLKSKLNFYNNSSPRKSSNNLRSSLLLSQSIQLRKSHAFTQDTTKEELEKWTELESEWISITDDLRLEIESNRKKTEKAESDLKTEKKYTEELDDALKRSVLGHAKMIEHYTELQERYEELDAKNRSIMERVAEIKRAVIKAGSKGQGSKYAKALVNELSAIRVEKEKEKEGLKKENKKLRIQVRDTAEALKAASEVLVRLRETEEIAKVNEEGLRNVEEENEKLKKEIEKVKRKHKMEMITMKQYLTDSKLPEVGLYNRQDFDDLEEEEEEESLPYADDQAWRAEFGAIYQEQL